MGNVCIECQGPCQLALAPALWCPGIRSIHERFGVWDVSQTRPRGVLASYRTMEEIAKLLTEYGKANRWILSFQGHEQRFIMSDMSGSANGELMVQFYTPQGWMDVVNFTVDENNDRIAVHSYATGFCPLYIPCAPLCSALFCWCPVTDRANDGHGHATSLHQMREQKLLDVLLDGGMELSGAGRAAVSSV